MKRTKASSVGWALIDSGTYPDDADIGRAWSLFRFSLPNKSLRTDSVHLSVQLKMIMIMIIMLVIIIK